MVVTHALLVAHVACVCPSFADLEVTDPQGIATAGQLDTLADEVRQFARWTRRDGVCIPAVEFVPGDDPRLREHHYGLYQGLGEPVLVAEDGLGSVEETTRHELCHALDDLEHISDGNPTVFVATDVDYWGDPAEQFAVLCQERPDDLDLARALHAQCGFDATAAQEALVLEAVFPAGAPRARVAGAVDISVGRTAVSLPWSGPPAAVGASSGRGLALGIPAGEQALALVMLDEFAAAQEGLVLADSVADDSRWSLIADASSAYVFAEEPGGGGWQVDLASLAVTPVYSPPTAAWGSVTRGTAVGDELWLLDAARDRPELIRWAPVTDATAERVTLGEPTRERFAPGGVTDGVSLLSDGDTLWMAAYRGLVSYSTTTGDATYHPLPAPGLFHFRLSRAGRYLVTFGIFWGDPRTFLLLFNVDDGLWYLPADPCGAGSVEFDPLLVEDGDAGSMWDNGPDEEPSTRDDWYFSKISVGPPP